MADIQFGVHLNLNKNELKSASVETIAGIPATSKAGRVYFNTASKKLMIDDGAIVKEIGSVATPLNFKGTYDASTNTTPDRNHNNGLSLGAVAGDFYLVSTAGALLTDIILEIGDSVYFKNSVDIAAGGTLSVVGDWATIDSNKFAAQKFVSIATSIGGGVAVSIVHSLKNSNPSVSVKRVSDLHLIELAITIVDLNTISVIANGTAEDYIVTVIA